MGGGNENRIRPSGSALSASCLRTGVRRKKCFIRKKCLISCVVWEWPFCSSTQPRALPWKVDKGRKETGLSMQRCFSQCIFPPVMSGLRASWVGKFVFKSLKGLPSPEFVSSPFCQCCLQWEANSEYWKREVTGKQCLAFELPQDQQVGVHTPAWENGMDPKAYLLVWPSWHFQWDSREPSAGSLGTAVPLAS